MIIDSKSKKVRAVGKVCNGLYYLVMPTDQKDEKNVKCLQVESQQPLDKVK